MPSATIKKAIVWESTGPTIMARIEGNDASNITQSTISSIAYRICEKQDPAEDVDEGTLNKTDVIFNTLQTPAIWTADDTGFNFKYQMSADQLPGEGVYIVEVKFTPTIGAQFFAVWELDAKNIHMDVS